MLLRFGVRKLAVGSARVGYGIEKPKFPHSDKYGNPGMSRIRFTLDRCGWSVPPNASIPWVHSFHPSGNHWAIPEEALCYTCILYSTRLGTPRPSALRIRRSAAQPPDAFFEIKVREKDTAIQCVRARAMRSTAPIAVSTSSLVLKYPALMRTEPSFSLPRLIWARGAQ